MPTFHISVINSNFGASNNHELPTAEAARRLGVKGALGIGADEIGNGKEFFGAEVRIEEGEETVARYVVSVGASPLQ
jgi:hypothetical protein